MDAVDQLGLGDHQHLGAVLEVVRVVRERLTPELFFIEVVGIDQGSHRPVEQHDPRGECLFEPVCCAGFSVRRHRQSITRSEGMKTLRIHRDR